jgi:MOSC domain-containing protein YiiM
MKLISLNVAMPQLVSYKGREDYTSIFKLPVEGERKVSTLNIEGDAQSDLSVHGGEFKAVYAYDISYYQHWKNILPRDDWGYGLFGENLTTENLPDHEICVGNIYQVGSVHLMAVQPRFPCFKLNIKFGTEQMVKQFVQQAKHGTYFSVVRPGSLQPGDAIKLLQASRHKITIQQLVDSFYNRESDRRTLDEILAIDVLPPRLRKSFESFTH